MKIILAAIVLVFAGIIASIGFYLHIDDIAGCSRPTYEKSECMPADAVVAISGGDTAARTSEAVRLYKDGWGSKLIFSGAAQDKSGPSNAEAMRRQALSAGVPNADIITEELSATTKENAENTIDIVAQNEIRSVILVTSAYHQRRANLEFNARTKGEVIVRNHSASEDNQWAGGWWWATPTGWYLAVSELVKITIFYLGGSR